MDLTPETGWSDHQPEETTVECGCGDVCGMHCKGDGLAVICPVEDIEWPCEVVVAHLHECNREADHRSKVHRCACGTEWWSTVPTSLGSLVWSAGDTSEEQGGP